MQSPSESTSNTQCKSIIEVRPTKTTNGSVHIHSSNSSDAISLNDFLEFLKLTCEVHESIDSRNLKTITIDYHALARNEFIRRLLSLTKEQTPTPASASLPRKQASLSKTDSKPSLRKSLSKFTKSTEVKQCLHPLLAQKLDEVINEGILDSILPFICSLKFTGNLPYFVGAEEANKTAIRIGGGTAKPRQLMITSGEEEAPENTQLESSLARKMFKPEPVVKEVLARRKPSIQTLSSHHQDSSSGTKNLDVVIHVCDEVKNLTKDFTCPQKLLVSKMGYFADVTAGQKLEDMDISVHCDIKIFEWLMKWVKKDNSPQIDWPTLDPSNVIPILISASFLQMEPLLLDCLSFCHARLTDIVKISSNLSCLNDGIISRLAAMFTNLELEAVKDKKDRILPRLWTKMIQSLTEPEAQALRGHYASTGTLFHCLRCDKLMTSSVSSYIHCLPQNMKLNRYGQLVSQHTRDNNWNFTNHVGSLYKEFRSWRKVYWRLWGECHFLFCSFCDLHFPVYQINWCQFHPDQPQFLGPMSEGRVSGPAGRYPCCHMQSYRFETLSGPHGCQYREHLVQAESDRDRAILHLAQMAAEGDCLLEAPPTTVAKNSSENWWTGITLIPYRSKLGLLPVLHVDEVNPRKYTKKSFQTPRRVNHASSRTNTGVEESSDTDSNSRSASSFAVNHPQYLYSSDGCESDSEDSPRQYQITGRKRNKMPNGRHWYGDLSARSNQDNQREYEEKAMKQVILMVEKKLLNPSVQANGGSSTTGGGSYYKLENEWKELMRNKGGAATSSRQAKK